MTEPPTLEDFRRQLVVAAGRRRTRDRLAARSVVAALGIAAVAIGAYALRPDADRPDLATAAALEIRRDARRVTVTLADGDAGPRRVEQELRAAGLDVTVEAEPVPPSLVGTFMTSGGPLPDAVEVLVGNRTYFRSFSVPAGWASRLRLSIGRAARDNETYARSSNAFAAGEPLACSGWRGLTAAQVADAPRDAAVGYDFRVITPTGPPQQIGAAGLRDERWADLVVVEASSIAPRVVIVYLGDRTAPPRTTVEAVPDDRC